MPKSKRNKLVPSVRGTRGAFLEVYRGTVTRASEAGTENFDSCMEKIEIFEQPQAIFRITNSRLRKRIVRIIPQGRSNRLYCKFLKGKKQHHESSSLIRANAVVSGNMKTGKIQCSMDTIVAVEKEKNLEVGAVILRYFMFVSLWLLFITVHNLQAHEEFAICGLFPMSLQLQGRLHLLGLSRLF
ncbi:hypothetical protein L7F22_011529 [Adiantum nelumboides]|nr:hypothetical protein [Adiantum nelumboides]